MSIQEDALLLVGYALACREHHPSQILEIINNIRNGYPFTVAVPRESLGEPRELTIRKIQEATSGMVCNSKDIITARSEYKKITESLTGIDTDNIPALSMPIPGAKKPRKKREFTPAQLDSMRGRMEAVREARKAKREAQGKTFNLSSSPPQKPKSKRNGLDHGSGIHRAGEASTR